MISLPQDFVMKNALILHGTDGNSQENWFPWLQDKLEALGYQVWTPDLPGADKPNFDRYNEHILANPDFKINSETIIIGHSSGAVAILGLLQSLPPEQMVYACYLVGSFKDDLGWDSLSDLFRQPLDFLAIAAHSRLWYFLHSDNDPYCPLDHARFLHSKIGGDLIVLPGQKHFSVGTFGQEYRQFPYLYHLIAGDAMTAETVVDVYREMQKQGVQLWIDGGWGVDALLGQQTRPHGDLDVEVQKKDLAKFDSYLRSQGYSDILRGDTSPHNYVLATNDAKWIDLHVIELDDQGNGLYGPAEKTFMFPAAALTGTGKILDQEVRCISPEWMVKFHSGYQLRPSDFHDVLALCAKFGIEVPEEYRGK